MRQEGIAYLNPEIWLKDYPPDIQDKFEPISKKARQQRRLGYSRFLGSVWSHYSVTNHTSLSFHL
jgi:hypothetical protein